MKLERISVTEHSYTHNHLSTDDQIACHSCKHLTTHVPDQSMVPVAGNVAAFHCHQVHQLLC